MQERALSLMGEKVAASMSIEGKFSSEGLASLAGAEQTMEMALAKSLVDKLPIDARRAWNKQASPAATFSTFKSAAVPVVSQDDDLFQTTMF